MNMIEIDDNVARKPVYAQQRLKGEFFKSGCSVAPAHPPKAREGKRGYSKQFAVNYAPAPLSGLPMPVCDRVAPKRCANAAKVKAAGEER